MTFNHITNGKYIHVCVVDMATTFRTTEQLCAYIYLLKKQRAKAHPFIQSGRVLAEGVKDIQCDTFWQNAFRVVERKFNPNSGVVQNNFIFVSRTRDRQPAPYDHLQITAIIYLHTWVDLTCGWACLCFIYTTCIYIICSAPRDRLLSSQPPSGCRSANDWAWDRPIRIPGRAVCLTRNIIETNTTR